MHDDITGDVGFPADFHKVLYLIIGDPKNNLLKLVRIAPILSLIGYCSHLQTVFFPSCIQY